MTRPHKRPPFDRRVLLFGETLEHTPSAEWMTPRQFLVLRRRLFLALVAHHYPQVLKDLQVAIAPALAQEPPLDDFADFKPPARRDAHARQAFVRMLQANNAKFALLDRVQAADAMHQWARDNHLDRPWVRAIAAHTAVLAWAVEIPADRLGGWLWSPVRYLHYRGLPLAGWDPTRESRADFLQRVHGYVGEMERTMREHGWIRPPLTRLARDARWLADYQVGELSKRAVTKTAPYSWKTIHGRIKIYARQIDLPLRPLPL